MTRNARMPMLLALAACSWVTPLRAQILVRPSVDECRAELRQTADDQLRREALKHLEHHGAKAKPAIPELVALFAVPDEELRLSSALLLAQFGADAVPALTKPLDAKDAEVRYYALATLYWMGADARKAKDAILRAVADPIPMVRVKAIQAAGRLQDDPEAVKLLVDALKDKNADVRAAALESLPKIGGKAGIAAHLYPVMSDPSRDIAMTAVKAVLALERTPATLDALLQLTERDNESVQVSIAQSDEVRKAVVAYGPQAVDKLLDLLERHKDPKKYSFVSFNAPIILGLIGSPHADRATSVLRARLLADNAHSQGAAYGLGQLGKLQVLADAIKNDKLSADLRRLCITQIDRLGVDAIPFLVHAAGSKDDGVRAAAIQAFGNLPFADAAMRKALIAALRDGDANVRRAALHSLQRFGKLPEEPKELKDALRLMLIDADDHNCTLVHGYFFDRGGEPYATLAQFLDSPDDTQRLSAAARLLLMPTNPKAPPPVKLERVIDIAVKGLQHKDVSLQMRCAMALAQGRHIAVQDKLMAHFRACATHPKAEVRSHGIRFLAYCSESSKAVHKEFAALLDDKDEMVRWTAWMNMYNVGLDFERALPHYEKSLKTAAWNREYLLGLALRHGNEKALPLLRTAFKEKDLRVAALQILAGSRADEKKLAEFLPELRAALKDTATRHIALDILGFHSANQIRTDLLPELRDLLKGETIVVPDASDHLKVVHLLALIQPAGSDTLFKAFESTSSASRRAEIASALAQAKAPGIIDKAMRDSSSLVRAAIAARLGESGDKDTHKYLVQALHDPNPEVRRAAALPLAAELTPNRIALLEDLLRQNKSGARWSALVGLTTNGAYRNKTCVKELTGCLTDRSTEVRIMAIQLLARLGPDAQVAGPALRNVAAKDFDEEVRQAAEQALKQVSNK